MGQHRLPISGHHHISRRRGTPDSSGSENDGHVMRRTAYRVAFVTSVALFSLIVADSVEASPAPRSTTSAGALISAKNSRGPKVAIRGTNPVFVPTLVTGKSVSSSQCSARDYSFAVFNRTKVTQQLELSKSQGGGDFGDPIPPSDGLAICQSKRGYYRHPILLVNDPTAKLAVKIT